MLHDAPTASDPPVNEAPPAVTSKLQGPPLHWLDAPWDPLVACMSGGKLSVKARSVNAVVPVLMMVKVTVTVSPGATKSAPNSFLILMPPPDGGVHWAVGVCIGNTVIAIPPTVGMQVTVAWLQSAVALVKVPIPVTVLVPE